MNERNRKTAEHFGLLHRLTALESELLQIPGVVHDNHDDGCYLGVDNFEDIPHVCACIAFSFPPFVEPKYNEADTIRERIEKFSAASETHSKLRTDCLNSIIETCRRHGLTRTEDQIEDYGAHWHIVFKAYGWKREVEERSTGKTDCAAAPKQDAEEFFRRLMQIAVERIRQYLPDMYEMDDLSCDEAGFIIRVFDVSKCTPSNFDAVSEFRIIRQLGESDDDVLERFEDKLNRYTQEMLEWD